MTTNPLLHVPQPIRYLLVGGATLVVYLATSLGLSSAGLAATITAGIAVFVSGVFNLLAHARITFTGRQTTPSTAVRYGVLLCINSISAAAVIEVMTRCGLSLLVANIIALVIITVTSYFVLGFWVLKKKNQRP